MILAQCQGDLFDLSNPQQLSDYIKAARGANDTLGPLRQSISDTGAAFAVMVCSACSTARRRRCGMDYTHHHADTTDASQPVSECDHPARVPARRKNGLKRTGIPRKNDPPIKWNFAKIWGHEQWDGPGPRRLGLYGHGSSVAVWGLSRHWQGCGRRPGICREKNEINRRLDELEQDPSSGAECWGCRVDRVRTGRDR